MSLHDNLDRYDFLVRRQEQLREEFQSIVNDMGMTSNNTDKLFLERRQTKVEKELGEIHKELHNLNPPIEADASSVSTPNMNSGQVIMFSQGNTEPNDSFPFTDREDIIQICLSSLAPPYLAIDAPSGFGKTTLLKKLGSYFAERDWYAFYIRVSASFTASEIADQLVRLLAIEDDYKPQSLLSSGLSLGMALSRHWGEVVDKVGIVLLFDIDSDVSNDLIANLVSEFVYDIEKCLRNRRPFNEHQSRFRAIFAGRSLITRYGKLRTYQVKRLDPFDFTMVEDSATKYLPDFDKDAVKQIVAHLFFLTGGHPGCIAEALKLYHRNPLDPETFMEVHRDYIWKQIVNKFVDNARKMVQEQLLMLEMIRPFRYLDYDILQFVAQERDLAFSGFDIADQLTNEFLLDWKGRFLTDGIVHRLLTLDLQHSDPNKFMNRNSMAVQIYAQRLQSDQVHTPERFVVEYLYHNLLQNTQNIRDVNSRKQLRKKFFEVYLPEVAHLWLENIDTKRWVAEWQALYNVLRQDWEFQFTVNYYLRDSKYNEHPYKELEEEMRELLHHK